MLWAFEHSDITVFVLVVNVRGLFFFRCGHEFCYSCGAEWKNKQRTCSCPIWDEENIINDELWKDQSNRRWQFVRFAWRIQMVSVNIFYFPMELVKIIVPAGYKVEITFSTNFVLFPLNLDSSYTYIGVMLALSIFNKNKEKQS